MVGPQPRPRVEVVAIAAWTLLALGVVVRMFVERDPERNNVYLKVFAPAARAFLEQRDLYDVDSGFRYPPLCAALFLPFELCGARLGSVLWRAANFAALLWGAASVLRVGFPVVLGRGERAVFLLVLASLDLGSLNNGQPNPLILGFLLLATTAWLRQRDAGCAVAVASSAWMKVYPLAYGMVLTALRPRLLLWLLPAIAVGLLLPFALRDPGYVAEQYGALFAKLSAEDRTGDLSDAYRDLRLIGAVLGVPIAPVLFFALQVIGGLGIVALCFRLRAAGEHRARVLYFAFGLTMCWFMLLGPATELSTYSLFAPVLAWGLVLAWRQPRWSDRWPWIAANALAVLSHVPVPRVQQLHYPMVRMFLPMASLIAAVALLADGLKAGWRRRVLVG
ncbi:MAG TPA: glycosyltransferase family 87 protein [Planctomycetota bacterium]|nr:glycosyltransferase family 87 protein [Planctomycetota bacterium]